MYSVSMYFITRVLRQLLTKLHLFFVVQSKRFFNLHVQWLFTKYDGGKTANNQIQEQRFEAFGSTQEWAWLDTLKVIFLKTSVSFSVSLISAHIFSHDLKGWLIPCTCNVWRQTGPEIWKSEAETSTLVKVMAILELSHNLTKMPAIGSNYLVSHGVKATGYSSNIVRKTEIQNRQLDFPRHSRTSTQVSWLLVFILSLKQLSFNRKYFIIKILINK